MSERNRELVNWDEPKEKEQADSSWASGAEQMQTEERELERDRISKARPEGSTRKLTEDRVMPEGMGGAGGGDIDDVGDVGYPEEASGRAGDEQVAGGQVIAEGMGGAGGGDVDDVGDVGFPEGSDRRSMTVGTMPNPEISTQGQQGWQMTGGQGGDIEIQRQMGSGSDDTDPGLPAAGLGADDVRAGQQLARGVGDAGTDVGAPWDKVDDAARLGENPKPRP